MTDNHPLLLEIGMEECPPKLLASLAESLGSQLAQELHQAGFTYQGFRLFASPRRLAVRFEELQSQAPAQQITRRGPSLAIARTEDGAWTPAAIGFARKWGAVPDQLATCDQTQSLIYHHKLPGARIETCVISFIEEAIKRLPIPRAMRWADGDIKFVRPVHWVLLMHGDQIIPGTILGVKTGGNTRGHRFHHPQDITLDHASHYEEVLERAYVLADFQTRKQRILAQVTQLAADQQWQLIHSNELLDDITSLTEWPVAILGEFEERYLTLPNDVLISVMTQHQRYFPLKDEQGKLVAAFINVANIDSPTPETVRRGNQRVLMARLADAEFFFTQDRKQRLEERVEDLKHVLFASKLGSLWDKTERLIPLTAYISSHMGANPTNAKRAALLAKCDLLTGMVGEFPELQAIMGMHYATLDGEPSDVAHAIAEQYLPRGANDHPAQTSIGAALAIADNIDTLVGIFSIGKHPTGEKDPYACRRAALSILKTMLHHRLNLGLETLIHEAYSGYQVPLLDQTKLTKQLLAFIHERLKTLLHLEGVPADVFASVAALSIDIPVDFRDRCLALLAFIERPEVASLVQANKRVNNLLCKQESLPQQAWVKDARSSREEVVLADLIASKRKTVQVHCRDRQYRAALEALVEMKNAVDAFFDNTMIMVDDTSLKMNRLALIADLRDLFLLVADLSALQCHLGSGDGLAS